MIFSLLFSKDFFMAEKYRDAGNEPCCLILRCHKNGVHGTESRQKLEEMCDFCLPAGRNSVRAEPKVDKNRRKCVIFVYRTLQNGVARS